MKEQKKASKIPSRKSKAVARYEILATGKYAGITDISLAGKIDHHTTACVLDKKTGLTWSRVVAASVGPQSNGKLPWTSNENGESVFTFAEAANKAKLGGHTDWRVPTSQELYSLAEFKSTDAYPNTDAFPQWPKDDWCWSSTTLPYNTSYAMFVHFVNGNITYHYKVYTYYVALVRG
jgi:Protein of unknown function (DUF1566)